MTRILADSSLESMCVALAMISVCFMASCSRDGPSVRTTRLQDGSVKVSVDGQDVAVVVRTNDSTYLKITPTNGAVWMYQLTDEDVHFFAGQFEHFAASNERCDLYDLDKDGVPDTVLSGPAVAPPTWRYEWRRVDVPGKQ